MKITDEMWFGFYHFQTTYPAHQVDGELAGYTLAAARMTGSEYVTTRHGDDHGGRNVWSRDDRRKDSVQYHFVCSLSPHEIHDIESGR